MENSESGIGAWRIAREGDGIQLQIYYEDDQRWRFIRLSCSELLTLIDALKEVVGR